MIKFLKSCLLALCLAVPAIADTPLIRIKADFDRGASDTQWTISTKQQNTPIIRCDVYQGRTAFDLTGYSCTFKYGKSSSATQMAEIVGVTYTNYILFTCTTNTFAVPMSRWYSCIVFQTNSVTVSTPTGILNVERAPEITGGQLTYADTQLNWNNYTFFNSTNGYILPGSNMSFRATTNQGGRVYIDGASFPTNVSYVSQTDYNSWSGTVVLATNNLQDQVTTNASLMLTNGATVNDLGLFGPEAMATNQYVNLQQFLNGIQDSGNYTLFASYSNNYFGDVGALIKENPTEQFIITNALTAGTTLIGTWWGTNLVNIGAGNITFRWYGRKTGTKTVTGYTELLTSNTVAGVVTQAIGGASEAYITAVRHEHTTSYMSDNVTQSVVGVKFYITVSGTGVDPTVYTYFGTPYSAHLDVSGGFGDVVLGYRGATNIVTASNVSGTYDESTRTLTLPTAVVTNNGTGYTLGANITGNLSGTATVATAVSDTQSNVFLLASTQYYPSNNPASYVDASVTNGLPEQIASNDIDIAAIQTNVAAQVIRIGAVENYTNEAHTAYGWGDHSLGGYFKADGSVLGDLSAWGFGISTANIDSSSRGASLHVKNDNVPGTVSIGTESHGAVIHGNNYAGSMTIGDYSFGAAQFGQAYVGNMVIGDSAIGAVQYGACLGAGQMYNGAIGAGQFGNIFGASASATNLGYGSLQLFYLQNNEHAYMSGHASLSLGANTVTNNESIVVGDGEQSHGDGSITAKSFWGNITGNLSGTSTVASLALSATGAVNATSLTLNGTNIDLWAISNVATANMALVSDDSTNAVWTNNPTFKGLTVADTISGSVSGNAGTASQATGLSEALTNMVKNVAGSTNWANLAIDGNLNLNGNTASNGTFIGNGAGLTNVTQLATPLFIVGLSSNQAVGVGYTRLAMEEIQKDTHNGYDATTYGYAFPEAFLGVYEINGQIRVIVPWTNKVSIVAREIDTAGATNNLSISSVVPTTNLLSAVMAPCFVEYTGGVHKVVMDVYCFVTTNSIQGEAGKQISTRWYVKYLRPL